MKGKRRIDAPWLSAPALAKVFKALERGGAEVRVVGGAVRDALLGRTVSEIDLATTALPDDVVELAATAGLGAHPTGLAHGTITVVADGQPFEVTTLRRDVETDGRHAVVAFTTDWAEDAKRRDFTINALSCNRSGDVFDPAGGLDDLDGGRVRFIGDAAARIREDYLRILRFFRFSAIYARGDLDEEGRAACVALQDGLTRLSGERIGAEMLKLLAAPRASTVAAAMRDDGILQRVIGSDGVPDRLSRLQAIEAALGDQPGAIRRLAALALEAPIDVAPLVLRLRLSNAEAARLDAMLAGADMLLHSSAEVDDRVALYRLGPKSYADAVRLAWAKSRAGDSDQTWRRRALLPSQWTAPKMPYGGNDIVDLGVGPGPRVGAILRAFEDWWIGENFPADAALLSEKLAALAREN